MLSRRLVPERLLYKGLQTERLVPANKRSLAQTHRRWLAETLGVSFCPQPEPTPRCDAKLFLDPEIAKELAENLNSAAEVPEPDRDVFNRLQDVVGLDAGEVELVAACVATPGAYLASGDKRAMEALAQPELADVALLLAGRIICLEQALVMLVESYPASSVISAIAPRREIDTAIRCVVGAAGCSEDNFREGLGSYIADLRKKTGPLLCMCPLE